jgi:hypothetical protein
LYVWSLFTKYLLVTLSYPLCVSLDTGRPHAVNLELCFFWLWESTRPRNQSGQQFPEAERVLWPLTNRDLVAAWPPPLSVEWVTHSELFPGTPSLVVLSLSTMANSLIISSIGSSPFPTPLPTPQPRFPPHLLNNLLASEACLRACSHSGPKQTHLHLVTL